MSEIRYTQEQLNAIIGKALAEERAKLKAEFAPKEMELAQREQALENATERSEGEKTIKSQTFANLGKLRAFIKAKLRVFAP